MASVLGTSRGSGGPGGQLRCKSKRRRRRRSKRKGKDPGARAPPANSLWPAGFARFPRLPAGVRRGVPAGDRESSEFGSPRQWPGLVHRAAARQSGSSRQASGGRMDSGWRSLPSGRSPPPPLTLAEAALAHGAPENEG